MIQNPLEGNISDSLVNLNFPSYKKILVTHDGSEMSNNALLHAILLTKIANAELVIVNVIEEDVVPPSTLLSFLGKERDLNKSKEELRNKLEGAVKKMLEEKIKEYKDHINLSYKVLVGEPTDEIIKYAEESSIDLIVMASRKITSIVRAIGSTVRKVIDNTRKPVLVIHEQFANKLPFSREKLENKKELILAIQSTNSPVVIQGFEWKKSRNYNTQIKTYQIEKNTCTTQSENVELSGILNPKGIRLLADLYLCKIVNGGIILNIPEIPIIKLVIIYIDYNGNNHAGALITPSKIQSIDKNLGLFSIELDRKMKGLDPLTGKTNTLKKINGIALYNDGDKPIVFKPGNIVMLIATFTK